jgi:mannosyltransferase
VKKSNKKNKPIPPPVVEQLPPFYVEFTTKHWVMISLIALIIIGTVIRFYNIAMNSLWLDETATLSFAERSFTGIWDLTASGGEFNPPLFFWVEHVMIVFGNSEFVLRFAPAIAGIITIPVFFLIGRELKDDTTGLISAFILTVSQFAIFYSQEARAYSLMLLFVSIALYFYLRALNRDSRADWILTGVFTSVAFWTHFYSAIVIVPMFLSMLWIYRKKIVKPISSIAVFTICTLPLIIVTVGLFMRRVSSAPTYGLKGVDLIQSTMLTIGNFNIYMEWFIIGLICFGMCMVFMKERKYFYTFLLFILIGFFVSIIFSYSIPMLPRYLIVMLPVFFTVIAYGISEISNRHKAVSGILLVVFVIFAAMALQTYYTNYSKEDWRGYSSKLAYDTQPGDTIVVIPDYMRLPLDYYYNTTNDSTTEYGVYNYTQLMNYTGIPNTYFIVTSDIFSIDTNGSMLQWIQSNNQYIGEYSGIGTFTNKGAGV